MGNHIYSIKGMFAKSKGIPSTFVAKELVKTQKAVYVYGHGAVDPHGTCCRCGRTLTHPGSILLGIGPECLGDWGMRDLVADSMTDADKARLAALITDQQVDTWLPRSVIKEMSETDENINVPSDHKMLQGRKKVAAVTNQAVLVKYQTSSKFAIKITFAFDYDILNKVKTLTGRRLHGDENPKYWTAPLSVDSVESLKSWGFEMDPRLEEFLAKATTKLEDVKPIEVPGLKKELFPFQKLGVSFIEAKDGRALIGDEMGLGKTAQALAWLQLHPEARPAVIVVPASLKLNWKREAAMWMDKPHVQILSGKKANTPIIGDLVIINYDILPSWLGVLQQMKPKALVIDEIHYIKNNTAKRTKAIKALGRNIPYIIGLSGTPIVNRPIEAFNALHLIDSTVFPKFFDYAKRYCNAHHNGFGWDFSGAKNTEELHEKLTGTVMLRRKKEDVLTELPDKTYSALNVEISNRREYKHAEQDFVHWLRETKGDKAAKKAMNAEALARIEGLKQLTIKGKLAQCVNWIRDFIEIDGKLVVFATHKLTIKALMDEFGEIAVKIDGSVSQAARQDAVDRFQNDDSIRLFVGNIKAAGVGITLTASSNVAFLELPWTPGDLSQAEDRCHRIGQKNAVNIYYLLAEGTIEEEIATLIDDKRKVLDSVLDGKDAATSSLLSELINKYS
jgi:SWI/SNF-related matrix-associated actin-dependent regulator of chromatin subfamily A-like protein 1